MSDRQKCVVSNFSMLIIFTHVIKHMTNHMDFVETVSRDQNITPGDSPAQTKI